MIREYNAIMGAIINVLFISALTNPSQLALLGNDLFVVDYSAGTSREYDATTGATINASLITGLSGYSGITVGQPYSAQVQQHYCGAGDRIILMIA